MRKKIAELLRKLPQRHRTRLAKLIHLSFAKVYRHVKLYRRVYKMANEKEWLANDAVRPRMVTAGWRWMGPTWALRQSLEWPELLDPEHSEHWLFQHPGSQQPCAECGGKVCAGDRCGFAHQAQ